MGIDADFESRKSSAKVHAVKVKCLERWSKKKQCAQSSRCQACSQASGCPQGSESSSKKAGQVNPFIRYVCHSAYMVLPFRISLICILLRTARATIQETIL